MREPLDTTSDYLGRHRRIILVYITLPVFYVCVYRAQDSSIKLNASTVLLILVSSQISILLLQFLAMWNSVEAMCNGIVLFGLVYGYAVLVQQAEAQKRLSALIGNCSCSIMTKQG